MATSIGDYEVYEELGRGGMAVVSRALDTHTGQIVALKVLRGAAADEPDALARLRREGRTANQLNHSNIVRVFDFGETDGQLYIAMEYVAGETLARRLAREFQVTEAETQRVALAVARALDAAYQHGVVHRDIKPANVLLGKNGDVKVSDLGLAGAIGTRTVTRRGSIVGTLAYMSPEVLDGKDENIRRDLYALGVMMYEMLTGLTPFEAKSESQMLKKKLTERPDMRPLRRASEKLAPVIERLLRSRPEERFPTPTALIEVLEGVTDLEQAHLPDISVPITGRLRETAVHGLTTITRMPRRYKLGAAGIAAAAGIGVATLALTGAFGGSGSVSHPLFSSGPGWTAYSVTRGVDGAIGREPVVLEEDDEAPPPAEVQPVLGTELGPAQVVCLRDDFPWYCPEDAVVYARDFKGGWEIPRSVIPDARWIWIPGVDPSASGDGASYVFTTSFELKKTPALSRIAFAADNKAWLWVNGEYVTSVEGANTITFFDLSWALRFGTNRIVVLVENEANPPCDETPCPYRINAAGLVLQGPLDWE
ncbi:MAG TPA: protein kinase [Dehalococcoidia bacterium]|nr:protein kinase [Dehalococcoidia bacterium]